MVSDLVLPPCYQTSIRKHPLPASEGSAPACRADALQNDGDRIGAHGVRLASTSGSPVESGALRHTTRADGCPNLHPEELTITSRCVICGDTRAVNLMSPANAITSAVMQGSRRRIAVLAEPGGEASSAVTFASDCTTLQSPYSRARCRSVCAALRGRALRVRNPPVARLPSDGCPRYVGAVPVPPPRCMRAQHR
jgi:hypothetical protein